jgi:hypothetical protein
MKLPSNSPVLPSHPGCSDAERLRFREEVLGAKAEAENLLRCMLSREAWTGNDMYKQVTGQSSVEQAIERTRRLIEAYDRVLAEMDRVPVAESVITEARMGLLAWEPLSVR